MKIVMEYKVGKSFWGKKNIYGRQNKVFGF